jgi:hypothetical protein
MLRPERYYDKWAVGDNFFPTYREASAYIARRRGELQREMLIDVLQQALDIDLVDDHELLADAILKKFKFTLRK